MFLDFCYLQIYANYVRGFRSDFYNAYCLPWKVEKEYTFKK